MLAVGEAEMTKLRAKGTKDAFSQTEYQPYIRAAHALGCLAYDEERYADAVTDLERVHAVDDGSVGIEARLIAAKALMKLEKPADAVALLEPAAKLEGGAGPRQPGSGARPLRDRRRGAREEGARRRARDQRPLRQDAARPHPPPRRQRRGRAAGIDRGGAALRADLRRRVDRRREEVPREGPRREGRRSGRGIRRRGSLAGTRASRGVCCYF